MFNGGGNSRGFNNISGGFSSSSKTMAIQIGILGMETMGRDPILYQSVKFAARGTTLLPIATTETSKLLPMLMFLSARVVVNIDTLRSTASIWVITHSRKLNHLNLSVL